MSETTPSLLVSRLLDLMAGNSDKRPGVAGLGNEAATRVARRASDYVEDHYADTIRMKDLCRFTGVSLRTLQRSFAACFQVSPTTYIKLRRLHAARLALMAGDSSRDTVSRIALDNGFAHLGRFSVDYRKYFGELPRETLASPASPAV